MNVKFLAASPRNAVIKFDLDGTVVYGNVAESIDMNDLRKTAVGTMLDIDAAPNADGKYDISAINSPKCAVAKSVPAKELSAVSTVATPKVAERYNAPRGTTNTTQDSIEKQVAAKTAVELMQIYTGQATLQDVDLAAEVFNKLFDVIYAKISR